MHKTLSLASPQIISELLEGLKSWEALESLPFVIYT